MTSSSLGLQLADEGAQHALDLYHLALQRPVVGFTQQREIMSEKKMVFKLAGRAHRNLEKAAQLGLAGSPSSLCNVGRDGGAGSSDLAR